MTLNAKNVLIGGGTGFIGTRLIDLLKHKGYGIMVVSRMPGPSRISWNDIHKDGLPKGLTAVVNLAGQNVMDISRRWTTGFKQNVYASRVNTTKALARAIAECDDPPNVFVAISGVAGYKPDQNAVYNEESPLQKFDFFSELCHEWEKVSKIPEASKTRHVIIRSGVVLGRNGGMIKQLYLPFYLGLGGPVGEGNQFLPWIHIDDLTNLILYAIETQNVEGVLNGVAPETTTNKQFTKAFAKALRRPAFIPLPGFVLDLILNKERACMLTKGQNVQPKRTKDLGFHFEYPTIESACKQIVNAK